MSIEDSMSEYERIGQMNQQLYIMKKNKRTLASKWKKSRELIEEVEKTLSDKEINLKNALDAAVSALIRIQVQEENPPLKRINLEKMEGEPVWVVSHNHDGRWGIVDVNKESVIFLTKDGFEEEYWFDYRYIFRYKKKIEDYTKILNQYGLNHS
jgi:hypothetical protein